jgi:serine phosphatase RsbU (regulator of sigma subunit)
VYERHPDGRRLWVPVLDSAERVAVLGITGGAEVPVDDWITLASLLGELIVTKERYGDHLTELRRQEAATVAAEMRWSLLPPLTFSSSVVGISGILQPSYGVAGDAFDYAVRDGHATIGLFDAMGHGLQASRLANLAIGAFRSARRASVTGQELLGEIDEVIFEQFGEALFVTGQIVELDLVTGVAEVRTAGHPPPVAFRRGAAPTVVDLRPGLPLGLGPSAYEPTTLQLEPGDALLLVSDGMYEAMGPDGSRYGIDRLVAAVQDRFDAGDSNPEVLRRVVRDVLEFQSGNVRDDMSAAIVRWRPEAVGLPEPPSADRVRDAA